MAVQAHFFAGSIPPCAGGLVEDQMWALKDYSALLFSAAHDGGCQQYGCAAGVVSAEQSDLTCNGAGGGGAAPPQSRKRGREEDGFDLEPYVTPSSATTLLPIPGMQKAAASVHQSPAPAAIATRMVDYSAMASSTGRPAGAAPSAADALVAELCRQQGAEIDALVRAECDRLRAGLEQARKRQRQAVARAAAESGAARLLREKEAELDAARRRAAGLEELLRQAAAETHAWRGAARGSEAIAAGLRATLDAVLLRGAGAGTVLAPHQPVEEGSGESDADDAQSCCFVPDAERARLPDAAAATATSSGNNNGRCRACGAGEASMLVLPCRHLYLCKACEPRWDACPVCLAAKTASIHVAAGW